MIEIGALSRRHLDGEPRQVFAFGHGSVPAFFDRWQRRDTPTGSRLHLN